MVWSVKVRFGSFTCKHLLFSCTQFTFSFFWREQVILIVKKSQLHVEILNVFQNALKTRRTVERAHCLAEDSYWEVLNAWD